MIDWKKPPETVWFAVCERKEGTKARYRDPTLSRVFRLEIDARKFNPLNGVDVKVFKGTVTWEEVDGL
jgi:hypothetical protein